MKSSRASTCAIGAREWRSNDAYQPFLVPEVSALDSPLPESVIIEEDATALFVPRSIVLRELSVQQLLRFIASEWFGPESIRRYAVRFRSRLFPGDSIHCTGRIQRVYEEDGVPHADLMLSARSGSGDVLVRGNATVRRWDPPVPG